MSLSARHSRFLLELGAVCLWGIPGLLGVLGIEAILALVGFFSQPEPARPSPNYLKWQERRRRQEEAERARLRARANRPLSLSDKVFGVFFLSAIVLAIPAALGLFS